MDAASLLSDLGHQRTQAQIARSQSNASVNFYVVIVPALHGEPIQQFAQRVVQAWGLERTPNGRDALVIISVQDREFRLQVSQALFHAMTDDKVDHVVSDVMGHAFSASDFDGGIVRAVQYVENQVVTDDVTKPRTRAATP